MKQNPLRVSFHKPEHGWLTVTINTVNSTLEFEVSDVPNNPLNDLGSALAILLQSKKGEQKTDWHLEPEYYHLIISREGEEFSLRIEDGRNEMLTFSGHKSSVIYPFAKELIRFDSAGYSEPHWPTLDMNAISKLKELIPS
ncbi:MAG: hypothetical protein AAF391_01510 [Bacteroidota bacterium]